MGIRTVLILVLALAVSACTPQFNRKKYAAKKAAAGAASTFKGFVLWDSQSDGGKGEKSVSATYGVGRVSMGGNSKKYGEAAGASATYRVRGGITSGL